MQALHLELEKRNSNPSRLKPTATVVRGYSGQILVERANVVSSQQQLNRQIEISQRAHLQLKQDEESVDVSWDQSIANFEELSPGHQLVFLLKVMRGKQNLQFNSAIGESQDDIETFQPLLDRYLDLPSRSIDDTASFDEFFGMDLKLDGWSLLRASASSFGHAPQCMRFLLKRGANPLQLDSAGSNVLTEALASTRKGKWEPWQILQEYVASCQQDGSEDSTPTRIVIPAREVYAAQLVDVTEAMLVALRHKKIGITPSQTREAVQLYWKHGFKVQQRQYNPLEDIQPFLANMYLIKYEDLRDWGYLPSWEEAKDALISLESLPEASNQDSSSCNTVIFVSHRWHRPEILHPDDSELTKYRMIMNACLELLQEATKEEVEGLYLWIDYCCIDQGNPDTKQRSIQSLPFYILMADIFLGIHHEEYFRRAWCMLECLFGSTMPVKTDGFQFCYYRDYHNDDNNSNNESASFEFPNAAKRQTIDPTTGGVTDPKDMDYIKALAWCAKFLYEWY